MKRNTILKWTILIVLLGYTVGISMWAHDEAARHSCHAIDVRVSAPAPVDSIVRRGVLDELKKYDRKIIGIPINQIDTRSIEKYLSSLNTFEDVNCMISANGRLQIHVTPMIPVMRVFCGSESYYINKDGKHIASNAEFFSDVPVVSGTFNRYFQPKDVLPLIRFINKDKMMSELTSMVVANSARDLIVVPKIIGHVINFGDTTRLNEKRDALSTFYREVIPHKGWYQYDTISVKFKGQIVATRRNKARLNVPEVVTEELDLEEATLPEVTTTAPTSAAAPAASIPATQTKDTVSNKP